MDDALQALAGVAGLVIWMLSMAWKKRKQDRGKTGGGASVRNPEDAKPSRRMKGGEFKRDYDPIEPS